MKVRSCLSKIFVLAVVFLPFFVKISFASNNHEASAFNRANAYYEQGNYDEAIKQYNSVLEGGWESGNLYYNLGNCYFKKGELGRAILNYEKARRIIPLDNDLESNYEYARSLIKGAEITSKKSFISRMLSNVFEKFTIDGLTILLNILYILILISVLFGLFFRQFKKQTLVFSIIFALFFVVSLTGLKGQAACLNQEAVVVAGQVDAKFEPMDKATTHFTLYEGMKVKVLSSANNWHKVRRLDNKSGWIEDSALAIF